MIDSIVIPVSTATSQELLLELTEKSCADYSVLGVMPTANVEYSVSPTTVINGNAIATITIKAIVMYPSSKPCGKTVPFEYVEKMDIAFKASGTNIVTLVRGADVAVKPAYVKSGVAHGVKVLTSVTATIA